MRVTRFAMRALALACLACLACPAARGQEVSPLGEVELLHRVTEITDAKLSLWVVYREFDGVYQDHVQYLEQLATRWQAESVAVGLVMPADQAQLAAKAKPAFAVFAPRPDDENVHRKIAELGAGRLLVCRGASTQSLFTMVTLDGVDDVLTKLSGGAGERAAYQALSRLRVLVRDVADGGQSLRTVRACLEALPKSGRAHAVKALLHWWCEGDVPAAEQAVRDGLEALAEESLPLLVFADLVLRGDRCNPDLAERIAEAVAPAARSAKQGAFAQLVYLRALLHAGTGPRDAGRMAAILPKRLRGRPKAQVVFAETLMDAEVPLVFRDQAERMLDAASVEPALKRWIYCARHKVLWRCGEAAAAAKLMDRYRKDPVGQTDLNNDAWYLMVQPATMGRFDTLAFAQASKMAKDAGAALSSNNRDTYALSCFRVGQFELAVAQEKQAAQANGSANFRARLKRYEASLAAQARRAADKDK